MENTSLRDPIRSETFIGPYGEHHERVLGPSIFQLQPHFFFVICFI
jgi:hypothetical protein